jgi:hypothetical protein
VKAKESKSTPPGLLEETFLTLALLLPQHDTATMKWYQKHQKKLGLDTTAAKCGQLSSEDRQIKRFRYWHDRLVILKQVFDDTEPSTVKQWWRDRRKRVQWYTFWVAAMVLALTVLFGLVQCVEGGLQVWKTYYPRAWAAIIGDEKGRSLDVQLNFGQSEKDIGGLVSLTPTEIRVINFKQVE